MESASFPPPKRKAEDNGGNIANKKKKKKKNKQKKNQPITSMAQKHTHTAAKDQGINKIAAQKHIKELKVVENETYGTVDCQSFFSQIKECLNGLEIAEDEKIPTAEARGRKFFEWLIFPVTVEEFYEKYWEKKSLLIKRHKLDYYDGWFSKAEMDRLLRSIDLHYSRNLDITKYEGGKRKTLNPKGRATPEEVWKFFEAGCSVRFLHPQQFSTPLWKMLSTLEDFWNCNGGCNTYLTPAGSQGFSPHYDDVEAFALQVEGRKFWRLYQPPTESEVLARYSSKNFAQEELSKPFLETELEPGDMLYFPRGTVHQAVSVPDAHSLHVTVSTAYHNSWFDFLSVAVPRALELAQEEDIEFRKSLPRDFMSYMGVMHSDAGEGTGEDDEDEEEEEEEEEEEDEGGGKGKGKGKGRKGGKGGESAPTAVVGVNPNSAAAKRQKFISNFFTLLERCLSTIPFDSAADQLAATFLQTRLPPYLKEDDDTTTTTTTSTSSTSGLSLLSEVRLARDNVARLTIAEDAAVVYTHIHNKRELHADLEKSLEENESAVCIDFPIDFASAIEYIIKSYPEYVSVKSVPLESDDQKLELASKLLQHKLLVTK